MSLDLLDRLIADICAVTETLMDSDPIDLSAWQPFSKSVEKQKSSKSQASNKEKSNGKHPMHSGVHRTVC
jgi:glutamate decarboxylase